MIWGGMLSAQGQPLGSGVVGRWVHLAAAMDGQGTLRLFVNGSLAAEKTAVKPGCAKVTGPLIVGASPGSDGTGSTANFAGAVDEVRVTATALYAVAFTPETLLSPEPETVALYHFDAGSGGKAVEATGKSLSMTLYGAGWYE
jgi:hypothetical protein